MATRDAASSGILVPIEMMVIPIILSLTPNSVARFTDPKISNSDPAHSPIPPNNKNNSGADPSDEIGDSLVEVLDDHLVADRGIDRSEDPVGAAEALGPELMQFVSDPAVRRSMTQRRTLVRTITSIEAFTTHSPDSN
jgi:hypothetical protein